MKKTMLLMATVVLAASCQFVRISGAAAQSSSQYFRGPVVTDTLDLKDFSAITVNGQGDVDYIQSPDYLVILTANEGVSEKLDCRVENGRLILEPQHGVKIRADKYAFTIYAPCVKDLTINGAADLNLGPYATDEDLHVHVNGAGDIVCKQVCVPDFQITVNGAGDIEALDMNVETLTVSVNGAGDARLSGEAGIASLRLSGAGDINATGLKAGEFQQTKNGVGRIRL